MSELATRVPIEFDIGITSVAMALSRQSFPPIYQDNIAVPALQHLDFGQRALREMPVAGDGFFLTRCKDIRNLKNF